MKAAFPTFLCFVALSFLLGCCVPVGRHGGTNYHLIVGFGIVATPSHPTNVVLVNRTQSLGLHVSDSPALKLAVGYSSSLVTSVSKEAENVSAEIVEKPFGQIQVNIPNNKKQK